MSHRRACALEREVREISAERIFHALGQRFLTFEVFEVDCCSRAHFHGKCQPLVLAVYRNDILDAHRAENCDANQANRTAALYHYPAVKAENAGCFRAFYRVNQNRTRLNQDSEVQAQVADVEDGRPAANNQIICKPAV